MKPNIYVLGYTFASYGLMCGAGILLALCLCLFLCKKTKTVPYKALTLFIVCLLSGFTGALVLYFIVSYTPREFFSALKQGTLEIGFVYYGGFISGCAGAYFVSKPLRLNIRKLSRVLTPCLPLAHAAGRVGCHLAGCCRGMAYNGPGAVKYPFLNYACFPVQLAEAGCEVLICAYLTFAALKKKGRMLPGYVLLYAPVRFGLEFLRGDEIRGRLLCFSTSQWISLGLLTCFAAFTVKKIGKT